MPPRATDHVLIMFNPKEDDMENRTSLPSLFRRTGASLGDHMTDLQRQIDRLFDDFAGRWATTHLPTGGYWPALEMVETGDGIDITAELPGVDPKDIDVSAAGAILTIRGEKKSEKQVKEKDYFCAERSYGAFSRTLQLPFEIDTSKVEAGFEKGVLKLHVTRPMGARKEARKIAIKST